MLCILINCHEDSTTSPSSSAELFLSPRAVLLCFSVSDSCGFLSMIPTFLNCDLWISSNWPPLLHIFCVALLSLLLYKRWQKNLDQVRLWDRICTFLLWFQTIWGWDLRVSTLSAPEGCRSSDGRFLNFIGSGYAYEYFIYWKSVDSALFITQRENTSKCIINFYLTKKIGKNSF